MSSSASTSASMPWKAVLLIMNCHKYRPKAMVQKNTWLRQLPPSIPYYHVLGDPNLDTPFRFDEAERLLHVKTPDDYIALPQKVIAAFEAVHKTHPDYVYVYKTDDDQTCLNIRFFEMVESFLQKAAVDFKKIHYGGRILDVKQAYYSRYNEIHPELPKDLPILPIKYCNGRFYLLSRDAITSLLEKKELIGLQYLEDYAIGLNLEDRWKENVLDLKTDMFLRDFV
jgi:hypothetical protein